MPAAEITAAATIGAVYPSPPAPSRPASAGPSVKPSDEAIPIRPNAT